MTRLKFLPIPLELYLKLRHETTFRTPTMYVINGEAVTEWYLADCPPGDVSPSQDEPDDIAELITRNGL
ncbi:hypothetical protein AMC85_CH04079 [Rhizobium phaseoli]|nr:hypothetical protein AMC88_CH04082 [Rhizobium phaseoli]ANL61401.1 hypothetical protein AMC85_CH04079 [Rhizobium phaseoli]